MPRPYAPRRAPPWWPQDEPWPPRGAPAWQAMRGRFLWRAGALVALVFFLAVGAGTLAFWLIGSGLGLMGEQRPFMSLLRFPAIAALVALIVMLILIVRSLRRAAAPVAELMEAAGRVESGDYSARVQARGPREVRALAQAFNAMAARLEANDEQRRNLLADVTHELRTPLTVIQGNLEGLLDGVYPRDDAHLTMILDETRVFARLVDDLRTLAQAESGTLKLQRETIDFGALIREVIAALLAQAGAAHVVLCADVSDGVPALDIDPLRIRAVLTNLIVNALRYTPADGRIVVSASLDAGRDHVVVAVADTGSGIPAEVLPHIFERFYKSADSRGSGLGLAIARHLVIAHGGEITVRSEPGSGTTIRFTLPVHQP